MKKIMNTTLVAVALIIAFVGNVDAKQLRRGAGGVDAKTVATVAADYVDNTTTEIAQDIKEVLAEDNLSADEREYAILEFQLADTNARIAFRKQQKSNLNYGLFGFFTASKDKKAEYSKINTIINNLEEDKKGIERDMATLKPVVGEGYTRAMKSFVGAVIIGAIGGAIDQYYGGNVRKAVLTKAGETGTYLANTRVGEFARTTVSEARTKASNLGTAVQKQSRTMLEGAKKRLGYGTVETSSKVNRFGSQKMPY